MHQTGELRAAAPVCGAITTIGSKFCYLVSLIVTELWTLRNAVMYKIRKCVYSSNSLTSSSANSVCRHHDPHQMLWHRERMQDTDVSCDVQITFQIKRKILMSCWLAGKKWCQLCRSPGRYELTPPSLENLEDPLRAQDSSGTNQSKSSSEKARKSSFRGFSASFEAAKQAMQYLKVNTSQEKHKERRFI